MYLLMATSQNVDRIIRDFSGTQQYAAAHLFFIDGTLSTLYSCYRHRRRLGAFFGPSEIADYVEGLGCHNRDGRRPDARAVAW